MTGNSRHRRKRQDEGAVELDGRGRLAQRREAAYARGAAREGRAARLLDVLLHQLHARHPRPQAPREEVPRRSSWSSASTRRSSPTRRRAETSARRSCAMASSTRWRTTPTSRYGRRTAVHAWPTLVLIDPEGKVVGVDVGRGRVRCARRGDRRARDASSSGKINREPIAARAGKGQGRARRRCRSPARWSRTPTGKRLFIADTNHNRIVVTDLDGKAIAVAGTRRGGDWRTGRSTRRSSTIRRAWRSTATRSTWRTRRTTS